jgi:hypothetical protein
MKALTLTQPWATLVMAGRKTYETRAWRTDYRGALAIHAARSMGIEACAAARAFGLEPEELPRGAVLGEVLLADCRPVEEVSVGAQERAYGDYSGGRFAWRLFAPCAYEVPIAAGGSLGLWNWDKPSILGPKER